MMRAVFLATAARDTILIAEDLERIGRSLEVVSQTVKKRMEELKGKRYILCYMCPISAGLKSNAATWKIYELEEQGQLNRFFFGLV
jgi:hypoxanthine phosphoribosyltransferase